MRQRTIQPELTTQELKHYKKELFKKIGEIGETNHSPTLRAKLIHIDFREDRGWFEVVEAEIEGVKKYNTAVGQQFYLPIRMSMETMFGISK